MHFLCPTCAPSKANPLANGLYGGTKFTNAVAEFANMMADLYNAPKPKKTIKPSESKTSEVITDYSLSAPEMTEMPVDVSQGQPKGAETTTNKKGGPEL